jgi:hypothetical protein
MAQKQTAASLESISQTRIMISFIPAGFKGALWLVAALLTDKVPKASASRMIPAGRNGAG